MIIDSRNFDPSEVQGSIAIIGAGAAGITLALELEKSFKDIVLIESGGLEHDEETQSLYKGRIIGHQTVDPSTSRLRFFGGTTNHWNGQCAPLDAEDFEAIPGRQYSGWPLKLHDLLPFYERAFWYCELGTYRTRSPFVARAEAMARRFADSSKFELAEFRYSPPTRFGARFRHDLGKSDRIKTYLYGNVTDISVTEGGNAVSAVKVKTLTGRRYSVKAAAYILCCGGIENARILLNCTERHSKGLGNEHDLVGRYFMDHLNVAAGQIFPIDQTFDFAPMSSQVDGPTRVMVSLKNSAELVRANGHVACSILAYPAYGFEQFQNNAKARETPAFLAVQDMWRAASGGRLPQNLTEKACTVLSDVSALTVAAYYRVREPKPSLESLSVRLEAEQSPNPSSRVMLIDERDALGNRRIGLDWQIASEDRNNIMNTVMELGRAVGASGFGRMVTSLDKDNIDSHITTCWHHMGTTRMHDDPRRGVVDRNCRLHKIENLFVAGSSVFPTGGRVNPTLTIVALAIRLSEHLKREVQAP
jgi:choline dehydrogenase-like flavoprotein